MTRLELLLMSGVMIALTSFCPALAELLPYDPGSMSFLVSVDQAEAAARAWAGNPQLTFTLRGVSFSAMHPSEPPHYVLRTTDGVTWSDLMYPPLDVGGAGYLHVRYLPLLYAGSIKLASKGVELRLGGRAVTLRPGSRAVVIDGKTTCLKHALRLIAGRLYIPYEAISAICRADVSWDAKRRLLTLTSRGLPLKPELRRNPPRKG